MAVTWDFFCGGLLLKALNGVMLLKEPLANRTAQLIRVSYVLTILLDIVYEYTMVE